MPSAKVANDAAHLPIAHPSADDDIGRRGINSRKGTAMSIIGWLILGLIAGFIASKIVNKSGEGVILDILLGIVGAVVGGFLFSIVGAAPVTGLNIYSMIVAVIGAVVLLLVYHAVRRSL